MLCGFEGLVAAGDAMEQRAIVMATRRKDKVHSVDLGCTSSRGQDYGKCRARIAMTPKEYSSQWWSEVKFKWGKSRLNLDLGNWRAG